MAPIQSSRVNQAECFLSLSDKKCTSIHCFHATSYPFDGRGINLRQFMGYLWGKETFTTKSLNVVWNNEQGMLEIVCVCSFLPLCTITVLKTTSSINSDENRMLHLVLPLRLLRHNDYLHFRYCLFSEIILYLLSHDTDS